MKTLSKCLLLLLLGLFLLFLNHHYSYSRKIGETGFYLVETQVISKAGKPLAGLYYKSASGLGYNGESTPGFPKTILWNERYIISKNFDADNPEITEYVVINLDSINSANGDMTDIHRFHDKKAYYNYLKQIELSEADMNQTDNHLAWWETLF